MAENPRIQELERRVARDPASIAFAQLAEEYRRTGRLDDAVRVARAGLERYPAYVSARVTLGRALLELEQYDDAYHELDAAVHVAPDNLAAIRALAELHQRRRKSSSSRGALEADAPATQPDAAASGPDVPAGEPDGPAGEPDGSAGEPDGPEHTAAAVSVEVQPPASEPVEGPVEQTRELHAMAPGPVDPFDEESEDAETIIDLSFVETFALVNDEGPELIEGDGFPDGRSSFAPDAGSHAVDDLPSHAEAPIDEPPARFTMWSPPVPAEPPSRSDIDDAVQIADPFDLWDPSAAEPPLAPGPALESRQAPELGEGREPHEPEEHGELVTMNEQGEAAEPAAQRPSAPLTSLDPLQPSVDPALPALEAWLSAILADRARRHALSAP